jgi:zinc/manganese transport system permease protein
MAAWAALVMSPVHALFGLHIVRRGLIFIDLAIAQVAALGMAFSIAAGHEPTSAESYRTAVLFALGGALLIAATRRRIGSVPHEAIIGIVFVACSAWTIVVLNATPHGLEELKNLSEGRLLLIEESQVRQTAWIYAVVLVIALAIWKWTSAITLETAEAPKGIRAVLFDFAYYGLLGFVVASSVKLAGVYVVFTWLVMPAVAVLLWTDRLGAAALAAVPAACICSILGLLLSIRSDWPTGASIVLAFSAVTAATYVVKRAGAQWLDRRAS